MIFFLFCPISLYLIQDFSYFAPLGSHPTPGQGSVRGAVLGHFPSGIKPPQPTWTFYPKDLVKVKGSSELWDILWAPLSDETWPGTPGVSSPDSRKGSELDWPCLPWKLPDFPKFLGSSSAQNVFWWPTAETTPCNQSFLNKRGLLIHKYGLVGSWLARAGPWWPRLSHGAISMSHVDCDHSRDCRKAKDAPKKKEFFCSPSWEALPSIPK